MKLAWRPPINYYTIVLFYEELNAQVTVFAIILSMVPNCRPKGIAMLILRPSNYATFECDTDPSEQCSVNPTFPCRSLAFYCGKY